MNAMEIEDLVARGESDRLEFKRDWQDLASRRGKAEFAKDILAMANVIRQGERGLFVFGVSDRRHGAHIIGVEKIPSEEQIAQVLAEHCRPLPKIIVHPKVPYRDATVSVLEVAWSPYLPHYSTRNVDGVLSTSVVYTRHGSTVGTLSLPELENLIRAKDARLGKPWSDTPLLVGFVSAPASGRGEVSARIENRTEEPVESVSVFLDIYLVHSRPGRHRQRILAGAALNPGEVRELSCNLNQVVFYDNEGCMDVDHKTWSSWLDLRLHVTYRDREGLLRELIVALSLA